MAMWRSTSPIGPVPSYDHGSCWSTPLMVLFSLRRYGLLGLNGRGKSTLLTAISCRELHIPEHMDIYHLNHEIEASDMSALQAVIYCDEERVQL